MNDDPRRLIEAAFPCGEVGAETQRERGSSSALPPLYFLHVWWARRPLTPSRAAVLASLLPAGTDPEEFLKSLGIQKKVALIGNQQWVLTGDLLKKIQLNAQGQEVLPVDASVLRALHKENLIRSEQRETIEQRLVSATSSEEERARLLKWRDSCESLGAVYEEEQIFVQTIAASPASSNAKIKLGEQIGYRFPGDAYGYGRAYESESLIQLNDKTVLDMTAGGGSIPFEALRCGCCTIANELNPVASTILNATLKYPFVYGSALKEDIEKWGNALIKKTESLAPFFVDCQFLSLEMVKAGVEVEGLNNNELINDYLYCRTVVCPHCGRATPLLNSCWLSKKEKNRWGVEIVTEGDGYRFRTYRVGQDGKGPQGQDPDHQTVTKGKGQCVHCRQAIDSDEIKAQARGESHPGAWRDQLYAVAAVRSEPVLDKQGQPQRYAGGPNKGQIKTKEVLFFRPPNDQDQRALEAAAAELEKNWDRWDRMGLIPVEKFPQGNDMRPVIYGMPRWCDLYTPRQLLGLLTLEEELLRLKPQILRELGSEKGKAVVTYLQFMIDKLVDYNSRQTRWEYTRCVIKGNFGRHDFSFKWTFGELILTGKNSGAQWGLNQILDAYQGLADLAEPIFKKTQGQPPLKILHGSADHMESVADRSVDSIVFDPPYYNNVQYAELSDFYYVWEKRGLGDLYPEYFKDRMTNKADEAVANPDRDGGAQGAQAAYEAAMKRIFAEARRVLKDEGVMVMMFTHKSADAWETLTRSLIESGWTITSCFPVESETSIGMNIKDTASAESSIFIACRKRASSEPGTWIGFGGAGVKRGIEEAVRRSLKELAPLCLNGVDEMVAAYGRALQQLSQYWPVYDGDRQIGPQEAMLEASRVVSAAQIEKISAGRLTVGDLSPEAAMVVTLLGLLGTKNFSYDQALTLARSLNVSLVSKEGGYEPGSFAAHVAPKEVGASGGYAPLVLNRGKMSILLPEQRQEDRLLERPQSEWDLLQGVLLSYRRGDVPQALSYLDRHCAAKRRVVLALLELWKHYAPTQALQKEAALILFGVTPKK